MFLVLNKSSYVTKKQATSKQTSKLAARNNAPAVLLASSEGVGASPTLLTEVAFGTEVMGGTS